MKNQHNSNVHYTLKLSIGALVLFAIVLLFILSRSQNYWIAKYGFVVAVRFLPVAIVIFFAVLVVDARWFEKRIVTILVLSLLAVFIIISSLSLVSIVWNFAVVILFFTALVIGTFRQISYIINLSISFALVVFASILFMPVMWETQPDNISFRISLLWWMFLVAVLVFSVTLVINRRRGNDYDMNLIVLFLISSSVIIISLLFYPLELFVLDDARFGRHLYYVNQRHQCRVGMACDSYGECGCGYINRLYRCNAYGTDCQEFYVDPSLYENKYEAILTLNHTSDSLQFLVNDQVMYTIKEEK